MTNDEFVQTEIGPWSVTLGLLSALFVLGYFAWSFAAPLRLHFIGTHRDAVVESCDWTFDWEESNLLKLVGYEDAFEHGFTAAACEAAAGETVTLLYSEQLDTGVILPGGRSIFHTVFHWQSGGLFGVVYVLAVAVGATIAGLFRLRALVTQCKQLLTSRYKKVSMRPLSRAAKFGSLSSLIADSAFVFSTFLVTGVLAFVLVKGAFYVETAPPVIFGSVLLLVGGVCLSPLPNVFLEAAWRIRQGDVGRQTLRTLRNFTAAALFLTVGWRALRTALNNELRYENLVELLLEIGKAILV